MEQGQLDRKEGATEEEEEAGQLLEMASKILISQTQYSASLAANIRSFYHAVELEERISKIENEVEVLRRKVETRDQDKPGEESKKSAAG